MDAGHAASLVRWGKSKTLRARFRPLCSPRRILGSGSRLLRAAGRARSLWYAQQAPGQLSVRGHRLFSLGTTTTTMRRRRRASSSTAASAGATCMRLREVSRVEHRRRRLLVSAGPGRPRPWTSRGAVQDVDKRLGRPLLHAGYGPRTPSRTPVAPSEGHAA